MATVAIHAPKTPVTAGSMGIAKATLPNVCKMPGPPAPFVPTPLPNIAKSGMSPSGYSTTVKIEGAAVAIRGAMFESIGDIASKGTGGGLLSANAQGPAKFITPGSLTVQIEGKPVHLLGEPMLNNCGPGGSPPNTGATMTGLDQGDNDVKPTKKPPPCPDGSHSEVTELATTNRDERDVDTRIAKGREAAMTPGDQFEMDAAQSNADEPHSELTSGGQISRNKMQRDPKGDSHKAHLVCVICGEKREVDQVLNEKSVVEAKSGNPNEPGQIANNMKVVADGGSVTYKIPHADAFRTDGTPTQRGAALLARGFKLVGI